VPGHSASVGVATEGITTVTYFATDAAGNDEGERDLTVRLDGTRPEITGLPSADCSLWPPNHKMRQVAVVTAKDALSGVAAGALQVTAASSEPSDPDDVLVDAGRRGGIRGLPARGTAGQRGRGASIRSPPPPPTARTTCGR
jgi:hypothetical protein